jgi:hypothetical protein
MAFQKMCAATRAWNGRADGSLDRVCDLGRSTMSAKQKVVTKGKAVARRKLAARKKVAAKKKAAAKKKVAGRKKVAAKRMVAARSKIQPGAMSRRAPETNGRPTPKFGGDAVQGGPADIVPIPPRSSFNQGLSAASEATMLQLLGVPGARTQDCSQPTGAFKQRVVTSNVGPFKATGLDVAVELLKAVFDDAKESIPEVVGAVKNDGMLCVRHRRTNPGAFSNHSWGTAIDLFYTSDAVPQGSPKTNRGNLLLAPIFNKHGWFWGAGFSGAAVDSMHFELAEETIRKSLSRNS